MFLNYLSDAKKEALNAITKHWDQTPLRLLFLLIFCTRIKVGNVVLVWLGRYSFEIYMLQRIPMMIFQRLGWGK